MVRFSMFRGVCGLPLGWLCLLNVGEGMDYWCASLSLQKPVYPFCIDVHDLAIEYFPAEVEVGSFAIAT